VGIALERGAIASLDDPAEKYARPLAGSPYGATPIRHLLRMSSGLTFTERYDGNDDVARLSRAAATGRPPIVDVLRSIADRHSPAGSRFAYASSESEVLGRVLSGATGRSVADLTSEWLWQPLGAERERHRDGVDGGE
jgi:CubicO group peptidase (beta-lactamase class C family)